MRADAGVFTTPLLSTDHDSSVSRAWVDGAESSPVNFATIFQTQTTRPSATGSSASFGSSPNAGPRHLRYGFNRTLTIGSLLVFGDVEPAALRADVTYPGSIPNDDHWIKAQRLTGTVVDPATRLSVTELTVWVFPEPVQTRALRFTKVAQPTDASYVGRISGVYLFSGRFANVSAQSVLYASAGSAVLKFVNDENTLGRWDNGSSGGPVVVSPEAPEKLFFSWPNPVTLAGLCFHYPGFTEGSVQRFIGSAATHPRDAADSDWETVTTFSNLRWQGSTRSFGIEFVEFPTAQTSRAFRVVITRAGDPVAEPGLGTTTFGGKKVWLNEGMALFSLDAAPLANAIVARACDLPAPISIPFNLSQAGYVTLVIEDSQGKRVRNLIGETFYPAGDHVAFWDGLDESGRVSTGSDGDYEIVGALVGAGTYRARGLVRDELNLRYEFTVNNSGIPPWSSSDLRGGWVSDHRPASDIAFIPASNEMLITAEVGEASPNAIMTDLNGRVIRRMGAIEESFYRASHLAQDLGPDRSASVMLYSAVLSRDNLYIHSFSTTRANTRIKMVSGYQVDKFIGGLAAWNRMIYLSIPASNVVHVIDSANGNFVGAMTVNNPRGLAFQPDGKLLVLSGTELHRYVVQANPFQLASQETLVNAGLEDPQRVIVQSGTGDIYVSNWGNLNQVKVFSSAGVFIRSIGRAGPLTLGLYDETQMHRPNGMALAPDGKLWVAEYDMAPKRVSVWNADGSFFKAFYGPPKYGGGGRLDSVDKNRFYYTDRDANDPIPFNIGMEWRLNWNDGTSAPHAIYSRYGTNDSPSVLPVMPPETAIYRNGRQYMVNSFNADDTGGNILIAGIWEMVGNVARPVAAAGTRNAWPILLQAPFNTGQTGNLMFIWSDLNGDYTAQPEEVQYRTQNFTSYQIMPDLTILTGSAARIPSTGFAAAGAPLYNAAAATTAFTGGTITASDIVQVLEGADGWHLLTGGPMQGFKNGVKTWTYPSQWPSLHASQRAPATTSPRPPGMMIGTTRLLGEIFSPNAGEAGEIWTINGNKGDIYMLTMDGLFIGRLFQDLRDGQVWATPPLARNTLLNELSLSEETFWPSVTKTADGNIYLVAGDSHSSLVRVEGLESIRRLPQTTFEVSNEMLAQCVDYRAAVAACAIVNTDHLLVASAATPPTIDGNHTEWPDANFVTIDPRASGSVMISQDRLYAAWKTESSTLAANSGDVENALFKSGGALDLMIGTNPQASPTRTAAVLGDLRLIIARVNNVTRALLYRPLATNPLPSPIVFTSPVRSISFARVDDVSASIQFAVASGRFEISVPLSTLGLTVTPGMEILGDIGILRGQDGVTVQRSYWHNEATGLVSDTPTESELTPRLWGRWVFEQTGGAPLAIATTSPLAAGQVGSVYNLSLAATGGTPDYAWSVSAGALPTGLSLNASGVLSGTPAAAGNFSFTARVTDAVNAVVTRALDLTIAPPPLVITTSASPPAGQVGVAHSLTFSATGGAGGYTWSVSAGTLPGGLTLSAAGQLTGTPNAAGSFPFTVRVTDAANVQTTKGITLIINPPGLAIVTASLPNATRGSAYSQNLAASGGSTPYTWTLDAGALPPGLNLSGAGALTGTPTADGTFNFTVRLTDNAAVTLTRPLSITIVAPPLSVATASLADGTVGSLYSASLVAAGGTSPYTWSVASGALPGGLSLSAGGAITGTPTANGTFNFTARVTDAAQVTATRALAIVVAPAPLAITTASLPAGTVGATYSQSVAATGGVAPRTMTISAGSLPSGLSLSAAGVISGTPVAAGTFNFTVRVSDSLNANTTRALSILINPAPVSVATATLSGGTVGVSYSQSVAAAGGTAPFAWTLSAGTLPDGLALSSSGLISGTPTARGTFNFTVRVTDFANNQATRALSIVIAPPALVINTTSLPGGTVAAAYSQSLSGSGGVPPYAWTVSAGALPGGLNIDASGAISGTPSAHGTFNFTLRLEDFVGASQTRALSIAVSPAPLTNTTFPFFDAVVGVEYPGLFSARGGIAPYSWSIAGGSLPIGLSLAANGVLSGTPTANGTFNFTARVTDSAGVFVNRAFTIVVNPPPLFIVTDFLPDGRRAELYSETLSATGGVPPYTWTVVAGAPPEGITVSSSGVVSGSPVSQGAGNFAVEVADSLGATATFGYTLVIAPPPLAVETTSLSDGVIGVAYSGGLQASGGSELYAWAISQGALPPGIALSENGNLTGTPTQQGTFNFTARVLDSVQASASRALSIVIQPAGLALTTAALPAGTQNVAYNRTLVASGGQPGYTWTLAAGALPAGLNLSASGVLSGTPTAAGTFNFTIQVADTANTTRSKDFALVIGLPPVSITTTSPVRSVTVNSAATRAFAATGGEPPYTWTIVSGVVPPGMTMSAAGSLSGTPTVPGTYVFLVRADDSGGRFATSEFSILAAPEPLAIPAGQNIDGSVVTEPFSVGLNATGGIPPYTWILNTGQTPPGITVIPSGFVVGTPTAAGAFPFTLRVQDSAGFVASRAFTMNVTVVPPIVVTAALADGRVGLSYLATLAADKGLPPYSWAAVNPAQLPPGLAIQADGRVNGTPTAFGLFNFAVRATDAQGTPVTGNLSLNVAPAPLVVATAQLPEGIATEPYSGVNLTATGGVGGNTWRVVSGDFPEGMTLEASGFIGGLPEARGTYLFEVEVTDAASVRATRPLLLSIAPAPLVITTDSLPDATARTSYFQPLAGDGGVAPYTWEAAGGTLPPGLSVAITGVLAGTPAAAGDYAFTLRIADSLGATRTRDLTMHVAPPPLNIVTATQLRSVTVGSNANRALAVEANDGVAPFAWTLVGGSIPPGMSLLATGSLTGVPTSPGSYIFTVRVDDSSGRSGTKELRILAAPAPLQVATTTLPTGLVGEAYSTLVLASGGIPPYQWAFNTGTLPPGLAIVTANDTEGAITGTPTAPGSFSFTARVTDSSGFIASRGFSITINVAPLEMVSVALPPAVRGTPVESRFTSRGGLSPNVWSVSAGSLPPGVSLAADGLLSGTPTSGGTFNFTLSLTDSQNTVVTRPLEWVVDPGLPPRELWRNAKFGANANLPIAADDADPDGDTLVNIVEYAFGLEPLTPDVGERPRPELLLIEGQRFLAVPYRKDSAATDVDIVVETSGSMSIWSGASIVEVSRVPAGPGVERITVRDSVPSTTASRRFMRINVRPQPAP